MQNKGNTELGNVIVTGTAVIKSGGNVTQLSGTSVRAPRLTILASGDITSGEKFNVYKDENGNTYYEDSDGWLYTRNLDGSMSPIVRFAPISLTATGGTYKGALIVYTDTLSASGADINIANRKMSLTVLSINGKNVVLSSSGSIQTAPRSGLISGRTGVMVTALGNIGTPFNYLRVKSGGAIRISDASSEYGLVYFLKVVDEYPITLVDDPAQTGYFMLDANGNAQRYDRPGTGLELTGYFTNDAYLWVGTHEQTAQTEGAAAHTIRVKITAGDVVLFDYDIRIDRIIGYMADAATGKRLPVIALDSLGKNAGLYMLFRLYIGEAYNGMTFRISYSIDGQTYDELYTVRNGSLVFSLRNVACEINVTLEPNAKNLYLLRNEDNILRSVQEFRIDRHDFDLPVDSCVRSIISKQTIEGASIT